MDTNNICTYLLVFLRYILPILAKSYLLSFTNYIIPSIIFDSILKSSYSLTFPILFIIETMI